MFCNPLLITSQRYDEKNYKKIVFPIAKTDFFTGRKIFLKKYF